VLSSLAAVAPAFHGGFGFFPLFFIGPLIWLIIVVLIIVFAVGGRRRRWARWNAMGYGHGHGGFGPWGNAARGAESTLAERFAQGDIDEKEYRARLEVLRANSGMQNPGAK
jgi:putative membrane protein